MTGKVFRSIGSFVVAVGVVVSVPTVAAAQAPAKPASLSGTWNMSLIGDHVIPIALVIEQSGNALTGTFTMMGRDFPVTGEMTGDMFTLTGKGPAFGGAPANHTAAPAGTKVTTTVPRTAAEMPTADMTIKGSVDSNGSLAGQMLTKIGERTGMITWTAERLKERKVTNDPTLSSSGLDLTGRWTLSIVEAQLALAVDLKQAGSKVTGTATSDHLGTMALEGSLANGTLTFATTGTTSGEIKYVGTLKADGSFAGELTSQLGAMTWTLATAKK